MSSSSKQNTLTQVAKLAEPLVCGIAAVLVVVNALMLNWRWFHIHDFVAARKIEYKLDDARYMLDNLRQHPTFSSLPRLLTENNWGDYIPLWRPGTSLLFWLEYKAIGEYRFDYYQDCSIFFHLLFVVMLALFTRRVTGSTIVAALAAILFAGAFVGLPFIPLGLAVGSPPCNVALFNWYDQPEMWCGAAILGAMLAGYAGRFGLSLCLAFLAVALKETGWLVFPLVFFVTLWERTTRQIPEHVWIVGIVTAIILYAARVHVLAGIVRSAATPAENAGWPLRYLGTVDGYGLPILVQYPLASLIGIMFAVAIVARRVGFALRTVALFVILAALVTVFSFVDHNSVFVEVDQLLDPRCDLTFVLTQFAYWTIVILAMLNKRRSLLTIPFLGSLLTSVGVILSPYETSHLLYIPSAFQSVVVATTLYLAADTLRSRYEAWRSQHQALRSEPDFAASSS